tara:strand:+ start:1155 stop:2576 length:1422 start_codon:yes stop_codon:yes gene_type:complete
MKSLDTMTVAELRQVCRKKGLKNYSDLTKAQLIKFIEYEVDCIKRSKLKLKAFQSKAVAHLMYRSDSLMLVYGTGMGKTLTAVAASQCYLDFNKGLKNRCVIVITPASLVGNFKKELVAYGATPVTMKRYSIYSFAAFLKKPPTVSVCRESLLIVDEAHNLRSPGSNTAKTVQRIAKSARKVLLLSATPFINGLSDLAPLANLLHQEKVLKPTQLGKEATTKTLRLVKKHFCKKIHYVAKKSNDPNFPKLTEKYVPLAMPVQYYDLYKQLLDGKKTDFKFDKPDAFYNAHRRAVNKVGDEYFSLKIKRMIPFLRKGQSLIYTNWVEFGLKPIEAFLEQKKITFHSISGNLSKEKRSEIVNDFNTKQFRVLIITRAGGEGLDLKAVRNVVVMEPQWNDAGLRQVIGRAVRYKSHHGLPESQRNVRVYKMILTCPGYEKKWRQDKLSGDALLYRLIENKAKQAETIHKTLRKCSI